MRPISEPHDIVSSIDYNALDVDYVENILLFFVSVTGTLGGTLTPAGMKKWLNTYLREAVATPVSDTVGGPPYS